MFKKRYALYLIPILFFCLITNVNAGQIEMDFDFPWYIGLALFMVFFAFHLLVLYILLVIGYFIYKKYIIKKYKDKESKHFIALKIFKITLIILAVPLVIALIIRCSTLF